MAKAFRLQPLLDLARVGSDSAAMQLGVVTGHKLEMERRLHILLEYRAEYAERLARSAANGMSSTDWHNFHEFIGKIDMAVTLQRELLGKAEAAVVSGQQAWHKEQRRLKSFDTLSQRHVQAERKTEARREQKEQDEHALKGFLGQRLHTG